MVYISEFNNAGKVALHHRIHQVVLVYQPEYTELHLLSKTFFLHDHLGL